MASTRPIVTQQARGEEGLAVEGVKAQKNIAGEVRNMRALNDIGNLVTGDHISRPITRSFGAQLLKAQGGGVVIDINKKKSDVAAQMVAKKKALPPAQKKICAKPKPQEEVIVISPDTEEKLNCSSGSRR